MSKKSETCPKKHKLPHVIKKTGARCTALYCAEEAAKAAPAALAKKESAGSSGTVLPYSPSLDDSEDREKAKRQILLRKGLREARREIVGAPPELSGEEAEKWADEKIVSLLPKAVAEIEYQLEYGSDEQRERAANKIMDANGRGKQERIQGQGQSIHIHLGEDFKLPWAKRVDAAEPKKIGDGNGS